MYTVRYDKDSGAVEFVSSIDPPRDGDLTVDTLPEDPSNEQMMYALRVVGGALAYVPIGKPTEPEPAQEPEPQAPTHAEIEAARAAAYRQTVDPITCEIQRLRDMGGTPEEIAEAEARREAAVAAVKEQYPYPEVTNGR